MKEYMKKSSVIISKEMIIIFVLTNLIMLGCWMLSRILIQAHGFVV